MSKLLLVLICIIFTFLSNSLVLAADEPAPPLDPKYMGSHGMVLINNGSNLYASLLPSYHEPTNMQLIYTIESKSVSLMHLVRDADLVTVKPQPFNLQHLMRDEKLTIKGDIYMGNFERDGMAVYKDFELNLDKQLYLRTLVELEQSNMRQKYDSVLLPNNLRILVHQIQGAPSYDNLMLLFDDVNCNTEFSTQDAVPKITEIYRKLAFCGSMKPLYYETQSFQ